MERRWVKKDGRISKELRQSAAEVQDILDANTTIANNPNHAGGRGSKDMRFLARVPAAMDARWRTEWRHRGGHKGTGMDATAYVMLKASLPDYSAFVTTPSGKTGFEKAARRIATGYEGRNFIANPVPPPEKHKTLVRKKG